MSQQKTELTDKNYKALIKFFSSKVKGIPTRADCLIFLQLYNPENHKDLTNRQLQPLPLPEGFEFTEENLEAIIDKFPSPAALEKIVDENWKLNARYAKLVKSFMAEFRPALEVPVGCEALKKVLSPEVNDADVLTFATLFCPDNYKTEPTADYELQSLPGVENFTVNKFKEIIRTYTLDFLQARIGQLKEIPSCQRYAAQFQEFLDFFKEKINLLCENASSVLPLASLLPASRPMDDVKLGPAYSSFTGSSTPSSLSSSTFSSSSSYYQDRASWAGDFLSPPLPQSISSALPVPDFIPIPNSDYSWTPDENKVLNALINLSSPNSTENQTPKNRRKRKKTSSTSEDENQQLPFNYRCTFSGCDVTYDRQPNLHQHLIKTHGVPSTSLRYKCMYSGCEAAFVQNYSLNRHVKKVHSTLPKKNQCSCGYSCHEQHELKRHVDYYVKQDKGNEHQPNKKLKKTIRESSTINPLEQAGRIRFFSSSSGTTLSTAILSVPTTMSNTSGISSQVTTAPTSAEPDRSFDSEREPSFQISEGTGGRIK